jgi:Mn2+/Fe2+ NRAMP family transporter
MKNPFPAGDPPVNTQSRIADHPPVPVSAMDYARAFGPGLIVAMAWLSAGDLVSASVSGSTYGYALMWALVISLFARYFFVSAIGKYVLCNRFEDVSILAGFGRLWRGFPVLLGGITFILGFTYQTYIIKGAATALHQLLGRPANAWEVFFIAIGLTTFTAYMLIRGRQYRTLELIAKISVGALMVTFFAAVVINGFDGEAFLRGLIFQVPEDTEGTFGAFLVLASIIGAVGGSAANLLYPYFMEDKGWTGPRYRRLQIFDLLVGIMAMVVINLAVWIVAAESLGGSAGIAIREAEDLAIMMGRGVGPLGPTLLWIGLFFVTFTSFPTYSFGFTKVLLDGVQRTFSRDLPRDQVPSPETHPAFKKIQVGLLLCLPVVFSLPAAPNFIALTIAGTAMAAITGPIIIVGVIVLTSSRKFMLPEYVNRWWEVLALLAIGGVGIWAAIGVASGLLG